MGGGIALGSVGGGKVALFPETIVLSSGGVDAVSGEGAVGDDSSGMGILSNIPPEETILIGGATLTGLG